MAGNGLGGERSGDFGDGTRGDSFSGNPRDTGQEGDRRSRKKKDPRLPPGFEDLILEDGRRLGDVLGAGAFGERDRTQNQGALGRIAAERLAQANRLGFTQSILKGKPPSAGQPPGTPRGRFDGLEEIQDIIRPRRTRRRRDE